MRRSLSLALAITAAMGPALCTVSLSRAQLPPDFVIDGAEQVPRQSDGPVIAWNGSEYLAAFWTRDRNGGVLVRLDASGVPKAEGPWGIPRAPGDRGARRVCSIAWEGSRWLIAIADWCSTSAAWTTMPAHAGPPGAWHELPSFGGTPTIVCSSGRRCALIGRAASSLVGRTIDVAAETLGPAVSLTGATSRVFTIAPSGTGWLAILRQGEVVDPASRLLARRFGPGLEVLEPADRDVGSGLGVGELALVPQGSGGLVLAARQLAGVPGGPPPAVIAHRVDSTGMQLTPSATAMDGVTRMLAGIQARGRVELYTLRDLGAATTQLERRSIDAAGALVEPAPVALVSYPIDHGGIAAAEDGRMMLARGYSGSVVGDHTEVRSFRLAADGSVVDPAGTSIGLTASPQLGVELASNGTHVLAAFVDQRARQGDIYTLLLDADGRRLAPQSQPLATSTAVEETLSVASDGANFFVTWVEAPGRVLGARFDGLGNRLDAVPRLLHGGTSLVREVVSVWSGSYYLVAFTFGSSVRAVRMAADGTVMDSTPRVLTPVEAVVGWEFAIAADPGGFVLAWVDTRSALGPQIIAARITPTLTRTATSTLASPPSSHPEIVWTGSHHAVFYEQHYDLHVALLAPDLTRAGGGILGNSVENLSCAGFDGARLFVAYSYSYGTYLVRVDAVGSSASVLTDLLHDAGASASCASIGGRMLVATTRAIDDAPHATHRAVLRVVPPPAAVGARCAGPTECASGVCADAVCCDRACGSDGGDCEACAIAAGSVEDGRCVTLAAGASCRAAAGTCDIAETCDGTLTACPPDVLAGPTQACRASAGACDVEEACSGTSPECPPDASEPDATSCADELACNGAELCFGGSCRAGVVPVCDDFDGCTADACAEPGGCAYEPILGCCTSDGDCLDADPCTAEACEGSMCVYPDVCADAGAGEADASTLDLDAGLGEADASIVDLDAASDADAAMVDLDASTAADAARADAGVPSDAPGCSCRVGAPRRMGSTAALWVVVLAALGARVRRRRAPRSTRTISRADARAVATQ